MIFQKCSLLINIFACYELVTVVKPNVEIPPPSPTTPTAGILKKPQPSPRGGVDQSGEKSCKLLKKKITQKTWIEGINFIIMDLFFNCSVVGSSSSSSLCLSF